MLLDTLGASFWGNMLVDKWVIRTSDGVMWAGDGVFRSRQTCKSIFKINLNTRLCKQNFGPVLLGVNHDVSFTSWATVIEIAES